MKKEELNELLTDLYTAYNPEHLQYVPQLVEKYHRQEFSAVEMILLKYNHDSYAHYDPAKATDEYILSLIDDYSKGVKSLKDFTIEMHLKRKSEQEASKSDEQKALENAAKEKAQEELSGIKNKLGDTEKKIENAQKLLDEKLAKINEQIGKSETIVQKVSLYDDVEISIKSNYTDSELKLPNKEVLAGLGKGTRLIVQDSQGKMVGLVVEEILYDCVSHPTGMPIIEIIISKG